MNYPDRVKVIKKIVEIVDGAAVNTFVTLYESLPCRFEILNATQAASWTGITTTGTYVPTRATLRLAKTLPDLPQSGSVIADYTFQIITPTVGWIKANNTVNWTLVTKKMTRTHVMYLIQV